MPPKFKKKPKNGVAFKVFLGAVFLVSFLALIFLAKTVKNSRWGEDERLNLLFVQEPLVFVSLDPRSKTLTWLTLPFNAYLFVPPDFGFYRLGAVWELGELEGKGEGGKLLAKTLEEFLALPVDGYLKIPNFTLGFEKNFPRQNFFSPPIFRNLKTNLSFFDLVKIWFFWQKAGFGKNNFLDLTTETFFTDLVLPDGNKVKSPRPENLESLLENLFWEEKIREENLKIEILNATEQAGLAHAVARLLTHLGVTVINVGNIELESVKDTSLGKKCLLQPGVKNFNLQKSFTTQKLAKIFSCQIKKTQRPESRADLVLIFLP